jgi:hypothetical protein
MTSPICATLSGSLSGNTQQGALTPLNLAYTLDAQTGHQQLSAQVEVGETKPISIPTNLGGPVATPDGQTMFAMACDVAGVDVTLNALGVPVGPFNFPKAGGVLLLPGTINGLPVSDVSIVNSGAQRATVDITAIYGS